MINRRLKRVEQMKMRAAIHAIVRLNIQPRLIAVDWSMSFNNTNVSFIITRGMN